MPDTSYSQRAPEENYKYLYFQEVNEVNVYQNGGINALFSWNLIYIRKLLL